MQRKKENRLNGRLIGKKQQHVLRVTLFLFLFIFSLSILGVSASHDPAASQLSAVLLKRNITPYIMVKNWVTGKPYGFVENSIYENTCFK